MIYSYEDDGKLHTRFSELNSCTERGVMNTVKARFSKNKNMQSFAMQFGTERHKSLAEESKKTKQFPKGITEKYEFLKVHSLDFIEKEMETEIFKDVVLHSTPDAVSWDSGIVVDYKTGGEKSRANKYGASMQIPVYAYQLTLRGMRVRQLIYILEKWDNKRENFIEYDMFSRAINHDELKEVHKWLKTRCEILRAGIKLWEDYAR